MKYFKNFKQIKIFLLSFLMISPLYSGGSGKGWMTFVNQALEEQKNNKLETQEDIPKNSSPVKGWMTFVNQALESEKNSKIEEDIPKNSSPVKGWMAFVNQALESEKNNKIEEVSPKTQSESALKTNEEKLFEAIQSDNIEKAEQIIEEGVNLEARNSNGEIFLHEAGRSGNLDMSRILLIARVDVDAQDNFGNTPAHTAAQEGHRQLMRFFFHTGARQNIKNENGQTAFDLLYQFESKQLSCKAVITSRK